MTDVSKQKARRLTRCRTGCMRCRTRRRKCDEGKPRCRNCVDRNFQCQYGPQLTFLMKNAQTVQPSEVETTAASYEAIRFVNESPERKSHDSGEVRDETSPRHEVPSELRHEPTSSTTHRPMQRADVELPLWSPDEPSVIPISQPNTLLFSDNDESAVAGLLALGTSTTNMLSPVLGFSDFGVLPMSTQVPTSQAMTSSKFPGSATAFSPSKLSQLLHHSHEVSPIETLELLRHFRYEIAPWLDICDLGQLFGIQGLQLAMASQPIWISVLALSEASIKLQRPKPSSMGNDKAIGGPFTPDVQLDVTKLIFLRALNEVKNYTTDMHSTWAPKRGYDKELMETFAPHAVGRDLNSAIYWLLVRLDLAAALATDTNIQVPLPPSLPYCTDEDIEADPFVNVFCFAHRPLWLCVRAVEFVHDVDPSPQSPPLQTWVQLVEDLERWHQDRPQGFQPIMELEIEDQTAESQQSFPLVLYANGGGVFANQLYHTAMLLLINNRPRTARINGLTSAILSPLWHAKRICSIALNNDRRECWDPCLLASFLAASRRMTHESQQQEIVRGFERIQKVTGWDAGRLSEDLRAEWSLLEM